MTAYSKRDVLLQARDLSLSYGDKCILHDINFTIRDIIRPGMLQGQVVSLVGRSGIGKTQLFRILSGLQRPSSGSITIRERKPAETGNGSIEVYQERPVRPGDMGVIFQNYYQFGWRTVKQSLLLAARRNKALAGKEEDTLLQYADQFDIADVLHRWPAQLSGGQQQRVSIIQQLLKGADFLLLDEPFSGLDVCVLDKVVELLLQVSLSDELKTLIIVSHDIATAIAISDTVFILGRQAGREGSTLVKEIDLIERGLAWQKEVRQEKVFAETLGEIKGAL
ncbi:MAG TPA: ATP-binding cassette domain-containing protein [Puia sp.]|jgi:polar amino acid transport system ATP-binding protein/sulfate transport system ATP-binding protein/NitT/TauT family transport system ATP-binding protein|nr:ATP-binding cassette domain-containing protein [Puia sp.]